MCCSAPTGKGEGGMTEREFERTVLETLRLFGWRFTHFRAARTSKGWRTPLSGDPGFPDIVAVRGKRILYIELKAERGRLSDDQGRWLAALGLAGADVHCWRPSDWPVIEETLRAGAEHFDPRARTRGNRPTPLSKPFASTLDAAVHAGSAAPIEPSVLRAGGY